MPKMNFIYEAKVYSLNALFSQNTLPFAGNQDKKNKKKYYFIIKEKHSLFLSY